MIFHKIKSAKSFEMVSLNLCNNGDQTWYSDQTHGFVDLLTFARLNIKDVTRGFQRFPGN